MTLLRRLNLLTRNTDTKAIPELHATEMREPDMRGYLGAAVDKVFVYGTLKKTFGNHHCLRDCTYIGEDKIKGFLFNLGGYPALVPEISGYDVMGEVYSIPDADHIKIMGRLDTLEGVPTLYWRLPFLTQNNVVAWAYWMPPKRILAHWGVIYNGRWIGSNSPSCTMDRYMQEHQKTFWPRKPKMRFYGPSKCAVVNQQMEIQSECMYYPESPIIPHGQGLGIIAVDNIKRLPAPPEEKKSVNLVNLDWLGAADEKEPKKCEEYHVEGI